MPDNWNDLRFVLAIARTGTLSAAAARLGVDQTTVGRRLNAIEAELRASLFVRSRSGFAPTETTEIILAEIEHMDTAAIRLSDKVSSLREKPSGVVRIATMPWILSFLIAPALPSFNRQWPEIELHALADLRERSLSRKEAEMSLRFELEPRGRETEQVVANIPYSVYIHRDAAPEATPWAGTSIDFGRFMPHSWIDRRLAEENRRAAFRSDDAGILFRATLSGTVKCLLPDVLARQAPELLRLTDGPPDLTRQLRILVHPDIATLSRVQCVIRWLTELFSQMSDPPLPQQGEER